MKSKNTKNTKKQPAYNHVNSIYFNSHGNDLIPVVPKNYIY